MKPRWSSPSTLLRLAGAVLLALGGGLALLRLWEERAPVEDRPLEVSTPAAVPPPVALPPAPAGPPQRLSLRLEELGLPQPVLLRGGGSSAPLYLPVYPGLRPRRLELLLQNSPLLPEGYLSLLEGEQVLGQAPLRPGLARVEFPLERARPRQGLLSLRLELRLRENDRCEGQLLHEVRVLPASRLLLEGVPRPPASIAGFFQPPLRRVHFAYISPLDPAQAEAFLWLAAYLGRAYRGQRVELHLVKREELAGLGPGTGLLERAVLWKPGQPLALQEVEGQRVLVLGRRADLVRLYALGPASIPFASEAAEEVRLRLPAPGPSLSLSALGYGPASQQGLGGVSFQYSFALADFGAGRYPASFRLLARHTPARQGRLELYLNSTLIRSLPLEGDRMDLWVPLPKHLLSRDNTLELRFSQALEQGQCSHGALPLSVSVDPSSSFYSETGSLLEGFDALPQGFLPEFRVVLLPLDAQNLRLAARLVQALQATTRTPLLPLLAEPSDSLGGPLLAVGDTRLAQQLQAPLQAPGFLIVEGERVLVRSSPGEPFVSLQAFSRRGPVLFLGVPEGEEALGERFLERLLRDGWYGLHGSLAYAGTSAEPYLLGLRREQIRPLAEPPQSLLERVRGAVYLGLGGVLLLLLAGVYPRVVRDG